MGSISEGLVGNFDMSDSWHDIIDVINGPSSGL